MTHIAESIEFILSGIFMGTIIGGYAGAAAGPPTAWQAISIAASASLIIASALWFGRAARARRSAPPNEP